MSVLYFVFCDFFFFFFKQKTAYEMRISDWSSDVCSSDLVGHRVVAQRQRHGDHRGHRLDALGVQLGKLLDPAQDVRQLLGQRLLVAFVDANARQSRALRDSLLVDRDRKSVVWGKSVSVRVDLGGSRIIKKKNKKK